MIAISALMAALPSLPRSVLLDTASLAESTSFSDSASIAVISSTSGSLRMPRTALRASRCPGSGESRILHLSILIRPAASMVLLPRARWMYLSGSRGWRSANQSAAMECQRATSSSEAVDRILSLVSGLRRTSLFLPNLTNVDVLTGSSSLRTSRPTTHSHPIASLSSGSSPESSSSVNPSIPLVRTASTKPPPSDFSLSLTSAASSMPLGVRK